MSVQSPPVESLNSTVNMCRAARDRLHEIKDIRLSDYFDGVDFNLISDVDIESNVLPLLIANISKLDRRQWSKRSSKIMVTRVLYRGLCLFISIL